MTSNPTAYRTKIAGRVDRLEPLDADIFEPVAYVAFGVPKADDLKGDRDAELTRVVTVKLDDFIAIPRALADELITAFRRHGNAQRLSDLGLEQFPNADHVPADAPPILDLGPTPLEVIEAVVAGADYEGAWIDTRLHVTGWELLTAKAAIKTLNAANLHAHELRRLMAREDAMDAPRLEVFDRLEQLHQLGVDHMTSTPPTLGEKPWSKMSARDTATALGEAKAGEVTAGRWPALAEHVLRHEAANRASKNLLDAVAAFAPELADLAAAASRRRASKPKAAAVVDPPPVDPIADPDDTVEWVLLETQEPDATVEWVPLETPDPAIDTILPRGNFAPLPGEDEGQA